jgi:hypothetical protein
MPRGLASGEGTAFPDRTSFIARIREGGIAAMELVARELKAMGVYTARALSYAGSSMTSSNMR